jgi:hypothetical protein
VQRKVLHHLYDIALKDLPFSKPEVDAKGETNYSYYAIVFESEEVLLDVFNHLTSREIFTRRYFYPVLSSLRYLNNKKCHSSSRGYKPQGTLFTFVPFHDTRAG